MTLDAMSSIEAQATPIQWPTVALVIEASLSVAQEWKTYLQSLGLILRRLIYAAHSTDKVNIAVIAYGSPYTLPSPILCKRYFDAVQVVFPQLARGLTGFGVDSLSAGGSQGMAALDGLVAALELFDHLQLTAKSAQVPQSFSHHLIHITSTGPDASHRPSWNDRAARDYLSWETLPDAYKESRVKYTVFSTRALSQRYQDLYETLNKEKPVPQWLTVKSPGTVLLALFPEEPPMPPSDPQKIRAQPTVNEPPKPPQNHTAPAASQPDVPKEVSPSPPTMVQEPLRASRPRLQAPLPGQRLLNTPPQRPIRAIRKQARTLKGGNPGPPSQINTPEDGAKPEESGRLEVETPTVRSPPQHLPAYLRQSNVNQSGPSRAEGSAQPSGQMMGHPLNSLAPPPFSLSAASSLSAVQSHMSPASTSARSISDSPGHPQLPNINPTLGPAQMNQFQKLMKERSERSWPPIAGGGMPIPMPNVGLGAPHRPVVPGMPNQHMLPNASAQMPAVQQPDKPRASPNKPIQVWEGTLNFKGTANGATHELCVYVTASTAVPSLARPETWPEDMHLAPTPESDVSLSEIREWIMTSYAAWVTFGARQYSAPEHSEYAFNSLVQILTTKKMFATAAWTTPSGGQTSNMFIFPVNGTHLVGACFPMTGIPDLPGKIQYPYPPENPAMARINQRLHYTLSNLSNEQKQLLEKMAPNQRGPALQALAKKNELERTRTIQHLQQAQRQLQQMEGSSPSPFGPRNNPPSANSHSDIPPSAEGMSADMSRMGNFSGMMQPPGGVSERPTSDDMPANISFMNMYQSFASQGEGGSRSGGA